MLIGIFPLASERCDSHSATKLAHILNNESHSHPDLWNYMLSYFDHGVGWRYCRMQKVAQHRNIHNNPALKCMKIHSVNMYSVQKSKEIYPLWNRELMKWFHLIQPEMCIITWGIFKIQQKCVRRPVSIETNLFMLHVINFTNVSQSVSQSVCHGVRAFLYVSPSFVTYMLIPAPSCCSNGYERV